MLNMTEMLLLLLGVVILVGGKKLPELGSGLGKGISEFKKAIGADKPEEESKQIKEGEAKPGEEAKNQK
jgi:sec-independent protein translocase protein TatA